MKDLDVYSIKQHYVHIRGGPGNVLQFLGSKTLVELKNSHGNVIDKDGGVCEKMDVGFRSLLALEDLQARILLDRVGSETLKSNDIKRQDIRGL